MKVNRWAKVGFTALTLILGVPIAANYSAVSDRWGWSTAIANYVAPEKGDSPVVAVVSAPWFLALFLLALGVALGIWIDSLTRSLDRWRAGKRWWDGLHTFTVKSFSCLVADVPEAEFEISPRAKAVAAEILSYVNSGHMPVAMETKHRISSGRLQDLYAPPYAVKNLGPEATIFKKELEGLARARKWDLPWPIPPKAPFGTPLVEAHPVPPITTNALAGLIEQAGKDRQS